MNNFLQAALLAGAGALGGAIATAIFGAAKGWWKERNAFNVELAGLVGRLKSENEVQWRCLIMLRKAIENGDIEIQDREWVPPRERGERL